MNELYEYLKEKIYDMHTLGKMWIEIDMAHAFRLFHLVCDIMKIRNIVMQEEDMEMLLKRSDPDA